MIRLDDTFFTWLPKIRERPGIFLGEPSLIALFHFWNGYAFRQMSDELESQKRSDYSKQNCKVVDTEEAGEFSKKHFMDGFEKFVYSYFGCEWSTQGWVKLITEKCSSDAEAFYKFFELLDTFMSEAE